MTTVAWDGKMLAADRQSSMFRGDRRKIHRIQGTAFRDYLFGGTGEYQDLVSVHLWLSDKAEKPEKLHGDDFQAILVSPSGDVFTFENGLILMPYEGIPFFSIGSGSAFAMAAMACDKTALQAVLIAHRFDCYTGPNTDTLHHVRA